MPLIPPRSESVWWPDDERIVGVVGVAPAATADFFVKLTSLTRARKDWEHLRVLIDSNPKIPSRGRYLELGETDPGPYLRQAIEALLEQGAALVAVPCNTAHILYERYADGITARVPHMIESTVDALVARTTRPERVAVFSSRQVARHGLYARALERRGGTLLDTSPDQDEISALIEAVKQGQPLPECRARMQRLVARHPDAGAYVLGCTELSLLLGPDDAAVPVIDSNLALAEHCWRRARGTPRAGANP
jgi:aspartate racemase